MELVVQDKPVFIGNGGRDHQPDLPWVIFVHGAAMDHTAWALQARYFAHHGRNVVTVDLPGHGRSEGPVLKSVADIAGWIGDLIDTLGAKKAAVVGHSLGALAALDLAANQPDKVSCVALLGVAVPMPVGPALLDAAEANDYAAFDMITIFGHAPTSMMGGNPTPGRWMTGSALRLLEKTPDGVLFDDFSACNNFADGFELAAKVSCPTLLILGDNDRMTPLKSGLKLAEAIEGAGVEVLEGCGHMMMVEGPDRVVKALKGFLT